MHQINAFKGKCSLPPRGTQVYTIIVFTVTVAQSLVGNNALIMNACPPALTLHTFCRGHSRSVLNLLPSTISLFLTCRASPGGRPCVAPNSWVSPYLDRSTLAQLSACAVLRSPHSGKGRTAAGGWTQGAPGPRTTSALCGSASCCMFRPCLGPPCCKLRCRWSVASCSCHWGCRLWLHRDRGCRFFLDRDTGNFSGPL